MKKVLLIFGLALLLCVIGCAAQMGPEVKPETAGGGLSGQQYSDENTTYTTGALPIGWRRLWGYDGDLAFYNAVHRATIMVNSTCGIRKAVPLVALRNHLLIDMTDRHIVIQDEVEVDMRTALHTVVQGRLDGALVKMELYVVQIDACVYDFAYISSVEQYDAVFEDFRKFVMEFHAKRKG